MSKPRGNTVTESKMRRRKLSTQSKMLADFSNLEGVKHTLIFGLLSLSTEPTLEEIRQLALERIVKKFVRGRSVVVHSGKGTFFQELDAKEVDLSWHVTYKFKDGPVPMTTVNNFVGQRYSHPMDKSAPLWRIYVVPKILETGNSMLIVQFDHTIGDGTGIREIFYSLTDLPDPTLMNVAYPRPTRRVDKPKASLFRLLSVLIEGVYDGFTGIFQREDDPNKLKVLDIHHVATTKKLATTETISLEEVKEIKNSIEFVTVNDVLVTLLNLTLKAYFDEISINNPKYAVKKDALIRGNYPIDMRNQNIPYDASELGNNISFDNFAFFFDYNSPLDCLHKMKRQLDGNKLRPTAYILKALFNCISWLPPAFLNKLILCTVGKVTATISNVVGSHIPLRICNHEVENMQFYTEAAIGLYFGMLSYGGKVHGSVTIDEECESNPELICKHWKTQFELLKKEVKEKKQKTGLEVLPLPSTVYHSTVKEKAVLLFLCFSIIFFFYYLFFL